MISSHRFRLLLLAVVILGGFLVLFYRLWFLQIENQQEYIDKQPVTATAKQRVPGARGRILDRNGVEFARNETNMEVALDLAAVEAAWEEKEHARPRKDRRKIPKFIHGPRQEEVTDIIAVLNETVFPELDRLKLYRVPASEAEKEKQKRAIITSYVSNKGVIPYPYEKNLLQADGESFKRFTAYAENAPNIPGLTITERPKRRYPLKAMAGHLIGYIRENRNVLPPEEKKAMDKEIADTLAAGLPRKQYFIEADDFGVAGLEQSMEEKLRAKPGERTWLKNEHGRLTDEIQALRRDPLPGADVFLTLDARIQMICEMALRDAGVGRGAVVVMNPNTGEVLAMASVPSYDPSIFIPPQDVAAIESLDKKNDPTEPGQCRALSADAPGSTFKLMTAIAASLAGNAGTPYSCPGFIDYGRPIACWIYRQSHGAHNGPFYLPDGIKQSCNCFFFRMGNDAGIDRIDQAAAFFSFGSVDVHGHTGIEVPEGNNGYIGSKAWWQQKNLGPWTSAKTAYISIGQGEVAATPLQICMLGAAVATGGKIYEPTLIHHYEEWQYDRNGQRQKIITEFTRRERVDLLTKGVKKRDMDNMREGMRRVVNMQGGTAPLARSKDYIIAGKTGTAQKKGEGARKNETDNRTWFMSFAPFEAPQIAVSVLAVNGKSGASVAAPIAKRVIERTLAMIAGNYNPGVNPLEPAKGHFNHLEKPAFQSEDNVPDQNEEQASDEDDGNAVEVVAARTATIPKAVPVEEDDTGAVINQTLEPVKFRLKSDRPNPLPQQGERGPGG